MVLPALPAGVQKGAVVPCMTTVRVLLLRVCAPVQVAGLVRVLGNLAVSAMSAALPVSVMHRVCYPSMRACNYSGVLPLYRIFCVSLLFGTLAL